MRIPNPTKLLPEPHRLVELTKRVAGMMPGLPGRGREETAAAPPPPSAPPSRVPPAPKAVPVPRAAAEAVPGSKPSPASAKAKAKAAKPKGSAKAKAPAKAKAKAKTAAKAKPKRSKAQPKTAPPGVAVSGFPEPPGKDPGDISKDRNPHRVLNTPVGDPDPTEWPDPYDKREDPRDPPDPDGEPFGEDPHPIPGARSTSEPHPAEDPAAEERREKVQRDKLDQ